MIFFLIFLDILRHVADGVRVAKLDKTCHHRLLLVGVGGGVTRFNLADSSYNFDTKRRGNSYSHYFCIINFTHFGIFDY